MATGKVGGGRTVALLTVVAVAVAALVPGGSCRPVDAAPAGGGEAERCVHRCARAMLACAAASGCASVRVSTSASRRGGGGGEGSAACGRGCDNEYLGCIDVC
ncbi:hypothetical protein SETIT_5G439300v2 [Setaria italica]|uniref:Uncharacterized protein n=2 Tax=Setaria TaxID=4554 RepID=A0A368RH71_SETIT|nr:hypothetical protein SETIT_5G439300v2 [Setaria italica]TKW18666.1 hypothetical protein SEVIR_5G445900v2 [Setaria viridis]